VAVALSKREDLRLQPNVCIIAFAFSRRKQHSRPQFGFANGLGESANI
jgi:hypothetical protein